MSKDNDDLVVTADPEQIRLWANALGDCDDPPAGSRPTKTPKSDRNEGDMPSPEQTLIVATSGGKDSAAMALWLRFESGLPNPMRFVHNDTGHEHDLTVAYLDTIAEKLGQEVERTVPTYTFESLAKHKQRFPSKMARFCTQELKVFPMQRWIEAQGFTDPVLCQG